MNKHKIVVFGPSLKAVSGVSTHVRMLLASDLARDFELLQDGIHRSRGKDIAGQQ